MLQKARKNKTNYQGFTLIEVIFAITIFALMMGIGYKSVTQVLSIKKKIDEERDLQQIALSVLSRLTHELQLASSNSSDSNNSGQPLMAPCSEQNKKYGKSIYFLSDKGDAGGRANTAAFITFIAPGIGQMLPNGSQNNGIVQITYKADKESRNENLLTLVREEVPLIRPIEKACKKEVSFKITDNLLGLRFRFYDAENEKWSSTWGEDSQNRIPDYIIVDLKLKTNSGKVGTYSVAVSPKG